MSAQNVASQPEAAIPRPPGLDTAPVEPIPQPPGLFLEPADRPAVAMGASVKHHPQAEPAAHLCTCGKVREACVHDEIRAFWSAVSDHAS
jgi:hypothetical protein